MAKVLLVEDDRAVRNSLEFALRRQGHVMASAANGEDGLALLREAPPDIVVLDLVLPGIDGFEVCRRVRALGDVPVVVLTARGDDFDVVGGLEAGADDYVVKPVEPRVLDARLRAVLRRGGRDTTRSVTTFGDLVVDRAALTVRKGGVRIGLTPTGLRLLLELSGSPGQVLSRDQLLRSVWEHDHLGDSRLVDACVQRLRLKIEDTPSAPVFVRTVRGFGYRFGPV
ncbi:response regulator transcription factor [Umezawaea sp. Da 62-37]|uniref:response regulator transcription factor n=1 Tax=Umezawaea sp. Da 62-37 TaxID=3075927 RepID=UPI0028F705E6|nr:response regulator transcription factor [Umezawaea sp. Da 62-37]WNV85600.1 response regulator transcription factor [Umezawaea sp. Da 62-37]